jgi:restriction system protein
MGRRRSNEKDFAEAIAALAVLAFLGWTFSSQFRAVVILVISIALICLTAWICYKIFKRKSDSTFSMPTYEQPNYSHPPIRVESRVTVDPPLKKLTISEQLRKIDWFQFEKLVELIYRHRGYSVQRFGGANPDGGVDLIVESAAEKFIVQCKHWRKWIVGVRHIREFLGAMADSKIQKGIFITLTGYSGDARQLAEKHGIQILNESDVIRMLEGSGLTDSQEVLELFSDSRKFCPKCENEMVLRRARLTGNQFWGCSNYPRCRFILNLE